MPGQKEETGTMSEEEPGELGPVHPAPQQSTTPEVVPRPVSDGVPPASMIGVSAMPALSAERAGDADRDRVVSLLRDHCVAGRLTLDEFSERTGTALVARTRQELDALLADLPTSSAPAVDAPRRRARRWIVAVMGESQSKGRMRLSGHTAVVAVMGQCNIDLSRAEIEGPETVITAVGIMGSIEIVVPEGIDVELTGLSVMGQRSISTHDVAVRRGSPRVLVRAFPIMGEVNVTTRKGTDRLSETTS